MKTDQVVHKGKPLDPVLRHELGRCAAELGQRNLAAALGLNPGTVARLLAGFPIYGGSLAAVRSYLERRAKDRSAA